MWYFILLIKLYEDRKDIYSFDEYFWFNYFINFKKTAIKQKSE